MLRAICVIHELIPATCTDREAMSIKNRMYYVTRPLNVQTSTLMKSVAVKHFQ
jgi:hypothetical protein